ncbi:TetR/AcrR family transcriptional regulator C-terminal domain-containing protein [Winogradskya humida]|nr:TetR/AcrR family transcriptional regulator C-terminal domain-containing protein [Actinoplanes humidus]
MTNSARTPLSRERVLLGAVALADTAGIDSLSMRKLAQDFDVVPMALYKHVAGKEDLLDGMVDVILAEIEPPAPGATWKTAARTRILSARRALLRHPWASRIIESRPAPTPAVLAYLNAMIGIFRDGGLSAGLTHHLMHTLGSRIYGFSQELFNATATPDPQALAAAATELAAHFPHVAELATTASHDGHSVVGQGCDDQYEFEFALDLILDAFERRQQP